MDYKGFSIDVKAKLGTSGRVQDVSYQVRRAGETGITYEGLIARVFSSEKDATDAAILKAQQCIDEAQAQC